MSQISDPSIAQLLREEGNAVGYPIAFGWDEGRFTGADGRPLFVYETTSRTSGGRHTFSPHDETFNRLMWGVLAKAVELFDCELYAAHLLSTHASYIAGFPDAATFSAFKQWLHGNWAREANIWHNTSGTVWGRRARSIPIVDEAALIERLAYNLSNGTKEGLVSSPLLWPGLHAAKSLCEGTAAKGDWIDRTKYWRKCRRMGEAGWAECTTEVSLRFSKVPCWNAQSDAEYRGRMVAMCEKIAADHRRPNRPEPFVSPALTKSRAWRRRETRIRNRTGCAPEEVGRGKMRPSDSVKKRCAPVVHSVCPERHAAYRVAYKTHITALRTTRAALEAKLVELKSAATTIATSVGPLSSPPP